MTWEGKPYPFIPMVSKDKWMEPRHTVNVTDRFTRDKTDSLQHAFFNGQGYAALENLWGFWYGMNIRTMPRPSCVSPRIERAMADYLRSPDWEPHAATVCRTASSRAGFRDGQATLWTIVNRNEYDVAGSQLAVPDHAGMHYYDLWHGVELDARAARTARRR